MENILLRGKYNYSNKYVRGLFLMIGDTFALLLSAFSTYYILSIISSPHPLPDEHIFILIGSVLFGLSSVRSYLFSWKYTSLRDLISIIMGIMLGGVVSLVYTEIFLEISAYEIAFTMIFLVTAIMTISGFRISKRLYSEFLKTSNSKSNLTIIYGADEEGEQILRDILKNNHRDLCVKAVFDDSAIPGLFLHGIKILGGTDEMLEYMGFHSVDLLIIAKPDIPKKDLKPLIRKVKETQPEIDIKILPSFHSLDDNPVSVEQIRDISIEDILGREPVSIDLNIIEASIKDKVVMVTGGGGSIGSELVRQCAKLNPKLLIALDVDETELFHIENELADHKVNMVPCVANITDQSKMDKIIAKYKPDLIFHAAAYKHVPMMESFPEEAIKVNIGGTQILARLSCKYGVDKFVMVSTDKAVNPTNVMGATKRVAEEFCMAYNEICSTRFISVRFGNVLGSRGSVLPIFLEQIKNGGPITVTHPEMQRYFMTIPEAVLLVMQSGSLGEGGEVFVLDMGEPVKIMDMARDLIKLHDLEPERDIEIEITGLRPGEKLFEELLNTEEGVIKTNNQEIFKATCTRNFSLSELDEKSNQLFNMIESLNHNDVEDLKAVLNELVPNYTYKKLNSIKKIRRINGTESMVAS